MTLQTGEYRFKVILHVKSETNSYSAPVSFLLFFFFSLLFLPYFFPPSSSMATAVNSKTLTMTQAMAVASIFEIVGAMTLGSYK
jgi:hypothetical protein